MKIQLSDCNGAVFRLLARHVYAHACTNSNAKSRLSDRDIQTTECLHQLQTVIETNQAPGLVCAASPRSLPYRKRGGQKQQTFFNGNKQIKKNRKNYQQKVFSFLYTLSRRTTSPEAPGRASSTSYKLPCSLSCSTIHLRPSTMLVPRVATVGKTW